MMVRKAVIRAGRPIVAVTDFDIRWRRLVDECRDLAQMAIGEGRAKQAAALLECEQRLAGCGKREDSWPLTRPNTMGGW